MMLSAVFAFGILFQSEAFQIPSNNTDSSDGPSPVTALFSHQLEYDSMLTITSTLHPDVRNSPSYISSVLAIETNATIFNKTNNSSFYETDTSSLRQSNATVFQDLDSTKTSTTKFPEMDTTLSPDDIPTEYPNVTNALTPEGRTENPFSKCPDIGGPQVAGSVVMCYCELNEIYVNGKCQVYDGAILIPVQQDWIYTKEKNVSSYNVTVQDVNCDTSKHSYMNFTKNQFHIRPRGDVVLLKEAGKLEGQRINNYCIFHHLNEHDQLTWTMKACVPIPSVPRCCPYGQAMKKGKCQDANTPDVLKPPISVKPFSDGIDWDNITEYESPLKCDSEYETPITIPLGHKQSNLFSLADGVANGWVPGYICKRRVYYKCPEYCVDGINNSEGSVDYFTSFCYSDPIETHKKLCANGTCLRKCCKHGYSMDKNRYSCVPDLNSTFTPPTDMELINYNIVIGYPLCEAVSKVEERAGVDRKGNLVLKDREFTSTDFCVDTFLDNEQRHQSALACLTTSLWSEVRPYILPVCNFISLIFITMTIGFYVLVPKLLANGGLHQLCFLISLFIAYISSFSVHGIPKIFTEEFYANLAIAEQFGFLAAFFWLNVMCFEIWRKIRGLRYFRPWKSYPNKFYMMYAWGIPISICIIAVSLDGVPETDLDIAWGVSRCWLKEDIGLLIYFYGPIAVLIPFNSIFLVLTYINYKRMPKNYKEVTTYPYCLGAGAISKQDDTLPSKQITDYVHEALSETLNSVQGFFICICLLSSNNKRKHLEEKYPRLFQWIRKSNRFPANMKRWLQDIVNRILSSLSSLTSSFIGQLSNLPVIRTLITSVRSPKPSSSSSDVQNSVSPL
ncbi:uncharacterized protein [Palaemon carinicauda]|uniref:uncharacterized protein isoform X2 n=1 Tax=Palaemon carinicauda TaxID=392227 RepID=UPI0035B5AF47